MARKKPGEARRQSAEDYAREVVAPERAEMAYNATAWDEAPKAAMGSLIYGRALGGGVTGAMKLAKNAAKKSPVSLKAVGRLTKRASGLFAPLNALEKGTTIGALLGVGATHLAHAKFDKDLSKSQQEIAQTKGKIDVAKAKNAVRQLRRSKGESNG